MGNNVNDFVNNRLYSAPSTIERMIETQDLTQCEAEFAFMYQLALDIETLYGEKGWVELGNKQNS